MSRISTRDRDRTLRIVTVLTGGLTVGAVAATAAASGLAAVETNRKDAQKQAQAAVAPDPGNTAPSATDIGEVGIVPSRLPTRASRKQARSAKPSPSGSARTSTKATSTRPKSSSTKPASSTAKPATSTAKPAPKPTPKPPSSTQPTVTSSAS